MPRQTATFIMMLVLAGCGDDPPAPITWGEMGPLAGESGRGSFRFGAASAATQIEDMNPATDWWAWTAPVALGGMGKGEYVGEAVQGYSRAMEDVGLVNELGLDSYRFSIEWARIEPTRDQIDETAIAHYRTQLMALNALGIRPVVTLHHFSNPIWVGDPRTISCAGGPTSANLCGYGSAGGPQIVEEMRQHATLIGQRFGDLVDEWGTVNEPVNYLFAAYGAGVFPPGKSTLFALTTEFVPVVRDYIAGHAAMYTALVASDTVDVDGDGDPAVVGLSLSVADWVPTRNNAASDDPVDVAARDRLVYLFHYLFVDALKTGSFDSDLDGTPDEPHPEWQDTIDWLGIQYYFRAGVSADRKFVPDPAGLTPCTTGIDFGSCLPTPDRSFCVPKMGYEFWPDGIGDILIAFGLRYPGLPLVVSEAGIATDVGARRAENIVRELESIARARDAGADVRGYYHWSLTDNFEWAEGFGPHFGLYAVDRSSFARTPTLGADVLREIAATRTLTSQHRATHGGLGPMTPELGELPNVFCSKL